MKTLIYYRYTWGSSDHGKLGFCPEELTHTFKVREDHSRNRGGRTEVHEPTKVDSISDVNQAVCGLRYTVSGNLSIRVRINLASWC